MNDTAPTRWWTGDAEVAHTDSGGGGETLLLMHGGGLADFLTPLAATATLARHRVIRLVRAGYTGAPPPDGLTVAGHAGHAAALLHHLGAAPAHVVAYSSGSTIALQLALDHPGRVASLTLVEPPLIDTLLDPADREPLRAAMGPAIGAVLAAVAAGDVPSAFDMFMTLVCGPGHRRVMTEAVGAAAVAAAERNGYLFTGELPAVAAWTLPPAAAAGLGMPVLLVQGGDSPPPVHRLVTHLAGLIPGARTATVDGAGHLMPLTHPAQLAQVVEEFRRSCRDEPVGSVPVA